MQLRVTFREARETDEPDYGFSTSLRTANSSPMREAVAFGVNASRQFRGEIERGLRPGRSYLLGSVESPSIERLLDTFEFSEPKVTLRKARHIRQMLWPVRDILSGDSNDVISCVRIEPTKEKEFFHSHEHSDRLVLITKGAGTLYVHPEEPRFFPRGLVQHELEPGDMVFLARGTSHLFYAGDDGASAIVWHCPYIPHGSPEYETELKATSMAMAASLQDVLRDESLMSVLYAIFLGNSEVTALCQALDTDRASVEQVLQRLACLKLVEQSGESAWGLHPTFRIEVADGKIHLIRDQDGTVARVSATIRN